MDAACGVAPTGNGAPLDLGSAGDPTMSKMDELRAMREQRYEQRSAAAATRPAAPKATQRPAPKSPEAPGVDEPAGDPAVPPGQLCGHRSINGRTCTRDQGHAAKSHRYS